MEKRKRGKRTVDTQPYEEFVQVQDELEDYDDLKALRAAKAKEHDEPTSPLRDVRRKLGI